MDGTTADERDRSHHVAPGSTIAPQAEQPDEDKVLI